MMKISPYRPDKKDNAQTVRLSLFFDGTLNNKNNTEQRWKNSEIFHAKANHKEKDGSYYNDWSNVARLWNVHPPALSIYIEGIGTEDNEKDQSFPGAALGMGKRGIRAKVYKGCDALVEKLQGICKKNRKSHLETLVLNVYGFSRGAAAARAFSYEISQYNPRMPHLANAHNAANEKYNDMIKSILTYSRKPGFFPFRNSYSTIDGKALEGLGLKPSYLQKKLQDAKLTLDSIRVDFLGLYDTVSSHGVDPSNDIKDLHLNELGRVRYCVQFTAEDEYRHHFPLINLPKGIQKPLPGVHSDVGGSYEHGMETVILEKATYQKSATLPTMKQRLLVEGWFREEQLSFVSPSLTARIAEKATVIVAGALLGTTHPITKAMGAGALSLVANTQMYNLMGSRTLSKEYSFLPLRFMAKYGIKYKCPVDYSRLKDLYSIENNPFLVRINQALEPYAMDEQHRHQIKPQEMKYLRNKYLHYSAQYARDILAWLTMGYVDPNRPAEGRKRLVY